MINAIESIKKLIEKNFLIRISMTVTPLNKEQVYSTINLAKKLGVNSIILSTVVPMGRGNNKQLLLNNEDINYLNEILDKANNKFQNFIFKDPESPFNENNENILNCGVITNSLTLDSGGNMKMCPMANVNNLNLGNVIKSPIEHILTNELTGLFSKLESPNEKYCKECEDLEYCNHCVARGLEKFYENPEKCNWMKCSEMRNILNIVKN